jgi:hypothetical protein
VGDVARVLETGFAVSVECDVVGDELLPIEFVSAELAGEVFPRCALIACEFIARTIGIQLVDDSALSGVSLASATLATIATFTVRAHDNDAILYFTFCSQMCLLE